MTHQANPQIRGVDEMRLQIDQLSHIVSDLNLNLATAIKRIDSLNERIKSLEQQRNVPPVRYR